MLAAMRPSLAKTAVAQAAVEGGRGRPRSPKIHAAILEACLNELGEKGLEGLTLEAVARRAGVGRPTLYRRWSSKEQLVAEAVNRTVSPITFPDTGEIWRDLESLAAQTARLLRTPVDRRLLALNITGSGEGSPLRRAFWSEYRLPRRAAMRRMLRRAQRRGELGSNLNLDLAIDSIAGGWMYMLLAYQHTQSLQRLVGLARFVLRDSAKTRRKRSRSWNFCATSAVLAHPYFMSNTISGLSCRFAIASSL